MMGPAQSPILWIVSFFEYGPQDILVWCKSIKLFLGKSIMQVSAKVGTTKQPSLASGVTFTNMDSPHG